MWPPQLEKWRSIARAVYLRDTCCHGVLEQIQEESVELVINWLRVGGLASYHYLGVVVSSCRVFGSNLVAT